MRKSGNGGNSTSRSQISISMERVVCDVCGRTIWRRSSKATGGWPATWPEPEPSAETPFWFDASTASPFVLTTFSTATSERPSRDPKSTGATDFRWRSAVTCKPSPCPRRLMFVPAVATYFVVQFHPEIGYDLVPEMFLDFEPARQESLHSIPSMIRPVVASAIISNNIQVTLFAYGLGLAAGIGTSFLLIFNGAQIGAIAGWMTMRGNGRALWGCIMPHGGTELLAIVLAGGAGLTMARAIIAPGEMRRGVALRRVARDALIIELGVMVMLACAGLIEGFVSPSSIGFSARLAILAGHAGVLDRVSLTSRAAPAQLTPTFNIRKI